MADAYYWLTAGIIVIVLFLFMEWTAWALHRFVMHGPGWVLHEDHHTFASGLQKNDLYGLFFAGLAIALIYLGLYAGPVWLFWAGVGVTCYGAAYFLFHDVLYHRRIKHGYRPRKGYLRRIINAHSVHHQVSSAKKGMCFGFLIASSEYNTMPNTVKLKKELQGE